MPSPSAGQHTSVFVHKLFSWLVQVFSRPASWVQCRVSVGPTDTPTEHPQRAPWRPACRALGTPPQQLTVYVVKREVCSCCAWKVAWNRPGPWRPLC